MSRGIIKHLETSEPTESKLPEAREIYFDRIGKTLYYRDAEGNPVHPTAPLAAAASALAGRREAARIRTERPSGFLSPVRKDRDNWNLWQGGDRHIPQGARGLARVKDFRRPVRGQAPIPGPVYGQRGRGRHNAAVQGGAYSLGNDTGRGQRL